MFLTIFPEKNIMKTWNAINNYIAVKITNIVGTMECAYLFAMLAIWGGVGVDWHNSLQIVQWVSQTFLQLVLLSVIMVAQNLLGADAEKRSVQDHEMIKQQTETILKEFEEIKTLHKELHQLIIVLKNYVEVCKE
jgi:hypothetical protein